MIWLSRRLMSVIYPVNWYKRTPGTCNLFASCRELGQVADFIPPLPENPEMPFALKKKNPRQLINELPGIFF